jgi:sporulation protein YlmC with PRC-barrel domain
MVQLKLRGDIAMLRHHIACGLLLTALTSMPALAQTKPDVQPGTAMQFITDQDAGHWRGSKLIGVNVYGPNDEKIGAIQEVLIDHDGNAQALVIGVGGLLGIGQKNVGVPFKTLKWVSHEEAASAAARSDTAPRTRPGAGGLANAPAAKPVTDASRGYPDHAVVSMTQDELKNAPDFRYAGEATSAMNALPTQSAK